MNFIGNKVKIAKDVETQEAARTLGSLHSINQIKKLKKKNFFLEREKTILIKELKKSKQNIDSIRKIMSYGFRIITENQRGLLNFIMGNTKIIHSNAKTSNNSDNKSRKRKTLDSQQGKKKPKLEEKCKKHFNCCRANRHVGICSLIPIGKFLPRNTWEAKWENDEWYELQSVNFSKKNKTKEYKLIFTDGDEKNILANEIFKYIRRIRK